MTPEKLWHTGAEFEFPSLWRPVHDLLASIDAQIAQVYQRAGITDVRPRYSMALIILDRDGPTSIRDLATEVRVTHSAMSQTVAGMKKSGLVSSKPGTDARTQLVHLTREGAKIVPFLRAEWHATEAALAALEREIPYALSAVAADISAALDNTSFSERIHAQLPDSFTDRTRGA